MIGFQSILELNYIVMSQHYKALGFTSGWEYELSSQIRCNACILRLLFPPLSGWGFLAH